MDKFAKNIKHNIVNAKSAQDLLPIMNSVHLDKLKYFLLQQMREDNISIDAYFKSTSIMDIFGDDVITHCLSYLPLNELYHTKSVCKSFEKINKSILSSTKNKKNNIIKYYEKYNEQFRSFQKWFKKEYKKKPKNKVAMFYLTENYGYGDDNNASLKTLKGKDKVLLDVLNNIGFKSIWFRKITDDRNAWDRIIERYYDLYASDSDVDDFEEDFPCGCIMPTSHNMRLEFTTRCYLPTPTDYCGKGIGFQGYTDKAKVVGQMMFSDEWHDNEPPSITLCDIYNVLFVDVSKRKKMK